MSNISRAIRAGLGLLLPRTWGPFVETYELTKFDHAFAVTWSQGAEDLGLLAALGSIEHGTYLDVGAHHPSRFSVTRRLYQLGWRGLNVEANPDLLPAFEKYRKLDKNLWACVGTDSEYSFNIFEEPALSTVSHEWRDKFLSENQKIEKVLTVPGVTLNKLILDNFKAKKLDLLCVDAEGSDLNVLESGNFREYPEIRPRWMLLESSPPVDQALNTPAVNYAINLGYQPHQVMNMSTLLQLKE
jgi:FkbM family methyltransferase